MAERGCNVHFARNIWTKWAAACALSWSLCIFIAFRIKTYFFKFMWCWLSKSNLLECSCGMGRADMFDGSVWSSLAIWLQYHIIFWTRDSLPLVSICICDWSFISLPCRTVFLIRDSCRHNWRWCTFFKPMYFWATRTQNVGNFGRFEPMVAIL